MSIVFNLSIDSDNVGMQTRDDLAEALRTLVHDLEFSKKNAKGIVRDVNGNRVGHWDLEIEDDDND